MKFTIPVANPGLQYKAHSAEFLAAVSKVLESGWYILGEEVGAFEKAFARYLGLSECFGVGNGTDAISLALRAVGVKAGDEVITVSQTAVATVAAVEAIGAIPVLADIDRTTRCIAPASIKELLSP